jgi:hypothetical protein
MMIQRVRSALDRTAWGRARRLRHGMVHRLLVTWAMVASS